MAVSERLQYRPAETKPSKWLLAIAAAAALVMLLPLWAAVRTMWGINTLEYRVEAREVVIRYSYVTVSIPRDEIRSVRQLNPTRGRRYFGTGLPGLQEGRWTFAETGPVHMYSTTTRPLTVIETTKRKWGISPADPEAFMRALESGRTGVFPTAQSVGFGSLAALVLLGFALPAFAVGMALYLPRIPGSIAYALTGDSVEITIAWSRVRIPYAAVTSAVVAEPAGIPVRSFGVNAPGIFWGRFIWRQAGPGLRLYTTRMKPLVLVHAGEETYGLTPSDMEGFMAELRRRLPRSEKRAGR